MSKYLILLIPTSLSLLLCLAIDIFTANIKAKLKKRPNDPELLARYDFYQKMNQRMKIGIISMFIFFCCILFLYST